MTGAVRTDAIVGAARLGTAVARLTASRTQERLTRQRAYHAADTPSGPEALTCAWLTAVLCANVPHASVTQFFVGRPSSGTTSRRAVVVDYNDAGSAAGLPTRLFIKFSSSVLSRVITGLTGAARAEACFYSLLRPGLQIESPLAYHASWHSGSWRSAIVLEDVAATRRVAFADPTSMQVTRAQAESQLALLATYHGTHWASPALDTMPWLPTALQFQQSLNAAAAFERRTVIGAERSDGLVPDALIRRRRQLHPKAMAALQLHASQPATLLHQDLHLRNWYSTPSGDMGLFDWQTVGRGNWALDVSYVMLSALAVEDRRAWEGELLAFYLDELRRHGGQPPTFDAAWLAYRQQALHALIFWMYTIGQGALQPDMQPRVVSEVNVRRIGQAVIDLESLDAV